MTRKQKRAFSPVAVAAAALGLWAAPIAVFAVEPSAVAPTVDARATPVTSPAAAVPQTTAATKFLSLTEIESRLAAQGIRVKEMEVDDKVLEVEGVSAKDGKVELLVDRRSGEILSRKKDR